VPNYLKHPPLNYTVDVPVDQPVPKVKSAGHIDIERKSKQQQIRILKVRLVGREEYDKDFIEIDLPEEKLTFRNLIETVCEEFAIHPGSVVKVRKLPNTKLRRDVEIQRLKDYQELEVETLPSS
jgi:hypothetical protein